MALKSVLSSSLTALLNGRFHGDVGRAFKKKGSTILLGDRLNELSSLGSTASGEGASLIGVEDAAGNFTGADVEAILAELKTSLTAVAPPNVKYAMPALEVDATEGAIQTKTLTGSPALTATGFEVTWVVHLILTNSGAVTEPEWPGTDVTIGSGTWDGTDEAVNHVYMEYDGTSYYLTIAQEA